jgi:hypothetical protein
MKNNNRSYSNILKKSKAHAILAAILVIVLLTCNGCVAYPYILYRICKSENAQAENDNSTAEKRANLESWYTLFSNSTAVSLSTLKPIGGGFTWNDGYPSDPFGTDYSNSVNYYIFHNDNYKSRTSYAEYKTDQEYTNLTFTISPYDDFGEDGSTYVKIYVNDVLRYTSDMIKRISEPQDISLDISDANTFKIEIIVSNFGCVILSNVKLSVK